MSSCRYCRYFPESRRRSDQPPHRRTRHGERLRQGLLTGDGGAGFIAPEICQSNSKYLRTNSGKFPGLILFHLITVSSRPSLCPCLGTANGHERQDMAKAEGHSTLLPLWPFHVWPLDLAAITTLKRIFLPYDHLARVRSAGTNSILKIMPCDATSRRFGLTERGGEGDKVQQSGKKARMLCSHGACCSALPVRNTRPALHSPSE